MPFQFGTNWSRFSGAAASVIGSLMAYEVLTAFYLEAAFLGVLLFGRNLVPQWAHVLSRDGRTRHADVVVLDLAVNSWMQTPVRTTSLWTGVSSRSACWRCCSRRRFPSASHTVIAFLVTSGFVILAVAAGFLRQRRHVEESRVMVKMSLAFLSIMVPLQIVVGDPYGLNTETSASQAGGDGRHLGRPGAASPHRCSRSPTHKPSATTSRSRSPSSPASTSPTTGTARSRA